MPRDHVPGDVPPVDTAPARRHGPLYVLSAVVSVLVLAIIVFLLLFRWNWLRPPLAHLISGRLHRPVAITGNLEVHPWSFSPQATVNGLVIGNAPWAGPKPLASLPRLTVQIKLLPLLTGKVILPLVEADKPDVRLLSDASGRANWVFTPGRRPRPLALPAIEHLIIDDGALTYHDAKRRLDFSGVISSNERQVGAGRGVFTLEGKGTLNSARFVAHVTGGPLVHVDPSRPYAFDARIEAGDTRVRIDARIAHPFNFAALAGTLSVQGSDLADLYHLTGLALPNSPPYSLSSDFARNGAIYTLRGLNGRVGRSDLEGSLTVDDSTGRPLLTGDLASRQVHLADLAPLIGGAPKNTAGQLMSPSEKIESARLKAEHRFLPDARLDVTRVRGMDAKVHYHADSVEAGKLPIRALRLYISLDHGLLKADPLDFTLPQGRLAGTVSIDARRAVPADAVDLRLTNGRLENLTPRKGASPPPLEGGLYARARLTGLGDSVRSAAAGANGALTVVVPGGEIRQAFAELLGIDVTKGLFLLLGKSQKETPIRCAVGDFQARAGILTADRIVLDTGVVQATGTGDISLRDETVNIRLSGKPKKFRLIHIGAPITFTGSLESPKVGVDIAKAAPQVAVAVAVGVFAAPVAAILHFVAPGLAKNADCAALLAQADSGKSAVKTGRR